MGTEKQVLLNVPERGQWIGRAGNPVDVELRVTLLEKVECRRSLREQVLPSGLPHQRE